MKFKILMALHVVCALCALYILSFVVSDMVFSNAAEASVAEIVEEVEEVYEPEEDLTGWAINSLTGLLIDEEAAMRRPALVVIDNAVTALPHSGIARADIIYEVLAEGSITRLIAVFRDFDVEKIGPVRSARHYFPLFALDNDAVFVHHGGSELAYSAISNLRLNNLDGMTDAQTFFRDPERARVARLYEHSSYTSGQRILDAIARRGLRGNVSEDFVNMFNFYETVTTPQTPDPRAEIIHAHSVSFPFSASYVSTFEFDFAKGAYRKYFAGEPHIDAETNEQLVFTNIIVQYAGMRVIDGVGRREVTLVGEGTGFLITNGVAVPIRWSKANNQSPTVWMDEAGNPLRLNRGTTYIGVFDRNHSVNIEFSWPRFPRQGPQQQQLP